MRVAAARSPGERESSCRAAAAVDKGVKGYAICGVRVRAQLARSSERRGASLCKWKAPGCSHPRSGSAAAGVRSSWAIRADKKQTRVR